MRIDGEIQAMIEHQIELDNELSSLHATIDQLDFEQTVIDQEKQAEEIQRIQLEDALWYEEYERVQ